MSSASLACGVAAGKSNLPARPRIIDLVSPHPDTWFTVPSEEFSPVVQTDWPESAAGSMRDDTLAVVGDLCHFGLIEDRLKEYKQRVLVVGVPSSTFGSSVIRQRLADLAKSLPNRTSVVIPLVVPAIDTFPRIEMWVLVSFDRPAGSIPIPLPMQVEDDNCEVGPQVVEYSKLAGPELKVR